jgi:hypothetical protein
VDHESAVVHTVSAPKQRCRGFLATGVADIAKIPKMADIRVLSPGATPTLLENPMPQLLLPIFPDAVTPIKELLSVGKQDGKVVYFHGVLPVFSHGEGDLATFRMITAQFIEQGHLRVVDVSLLVHKG